MQFPIRFRQTLLTLLWLTLLNSALIFIVSLRYAGHFDLIASWRQWLYVPTGLWGYAFACCLGWFLISLVFSFSRRLVYGLCVITFALTFSLLIIDQVVYDIYRFHINPFFIELFFTANDDFGITIWMTLGIFGLPVLFSAIQISLIRWIERRLTTVFSWRRALQLTGMGALCFCLGQFIHAWAFENDDYSITGITPHLPLYFPVRAHGFLKKLGLAKTSHQTAAFLQTDSQTTLTYPLTDCQCQTPQNSPNILFIILESWRFDMLDSVITPNMAALAQKSSVFQNHLSGGNVTTTGIFSIFYGLAPTYWFTIGANPAAVGAPVLLETAAKNNYQFRFLSTTELHRFKLQETVFRNTQADLQIISVKPAWQADATMNKRFIEFLKNERDPNRPFMGMVFYESTHHKYFYPPDRPEIYTPTQQISFPELTAELDGTPFRNRYKNAVNYLDSLIAELIAALAEAGLQENTILIITGDHGEEFNENHDNYWGHGSNFTKYQTQTPLLVYWPGRPGGVINARTCHIDIVPTLMQNVFGCTTSASIYSSGQNLFAATPRAGLIIASYVNYAFISDQTTYALYPGYLKKYSFDNILAAPGREISPADMKLLLNEKSRFSTQN